MLGRRVVLVALSVAGRVGSLGSDVAVEVREVPRASADEGRRAAADCGRLEAVREICDEGRGSEPDGPVYDGARTGNKVRISR